MSVLYATFGPGNDENVRCCANVVTRELSYDNKYRIELKRCDNYNTGVFHYLRHPNINVHICTKHKDEYAQMRRDVEDACGKEGACDTLIRTKPEASMSTEKLVDLGNKCHRCAVARYRMSAIYFSKDIDEGHRNIANAYFGRYIKCMQMVRDRAMKDADGGDGQDVKDTAGGDGQDVKDTAGGEGQDVKDTAGGDGQDVKDAVGGDGQDVKDVGQGSDEVHAGDEIPADAGNDDYVDVDTSKCATRDISIETTATQQQQLAFFDSVVVTSDWKLHPDVFEHASGNEVLGMHVARLLHALDGAKSTFEKFGKSLENSCFRMFFGSGKNPETRSIISAAICYDYTMHTDISGNEPMFDSREWNEWHYSAEFVHLSYEMRMRALCGGKASEEEYEKFVEYKYDMPPSGVTGNSSVEEILHAVKAGYAFFFKGYSYQLIRNTGFGDTFYAHIVETRDEYMIDAFRYVESAFRSVRDDLLQDDSPLRICISADDKFKYINRRAFEESYGCTVYFSTHKLRSFSNLVGFIDFKSDERARLLDKTDVLLLNFDTYASPREHVAEFIRNHRVCTVSYTQMDWKKKVTTEQIPIPYGARVVAIDVRMFSPLFTISQFIGECIVPAESVHLLVVMGGSNDMLKDAKKAVGGNKISVYISIRSKQNVAVASSDLTAKLREKLAISRKNRSARYII